MKIVVVGSVEAVIAQVIECEPSACIVVKSTIPVGFTEDMSERLKTDAVLFSPEFLREGNAPIFMSEFRPPPKFS